MLLLEQSDLGQIVFAHDFFSSEPCDKNCRNVQRTYLFMCPLKMKEIGIIIYLQRGSNYAGFRAKRQGFFLGVSGAVIRPLFQWQMPTFFPSLHKKIPIRRSFLCKSIYVNKLPSYSMDLNQNKAYNQE